VIYRLGRLELDEERFELRLGGEVQPIQPKVLKLLLHLVHNRNRVVPSEELLSAVWSDTTVAPNSLARAVSLARLAIARGAPDAEIANAPRRGYRFRGEIERVGASGGAAYVGRARARAKLEAVLDAALGGRGCVLLLTGEAGIGKTRTAELLSERARAHGALTVTASGETPWSPVLQSLRAADHWAWRSLPAPQRRALELGRPSDAVQSLLVRAASARPIAVVIDDLHLANTESLCLLEELCSAIADAPVAIVATCREREIGSTDRRGAAFERLRRASNVERWPLEALTAAEVAELVRTAREREPEESLVRALARQTGGNPLLLRESLRSLEARGLLERARSQEEWESLLPTSIRHLLEPKLRTLRAGALDSLGCAAALGLESHRDRIQRVVRDPRTLERDLDACIAAGLLEESVGGARVRFPHLLIREAVYAELVPPGELRRELHARAAEAADDPSERAHHACEAVPRVPAAQAAALALSAAEEYARRRDFEGALAWARRALAALDHDGAAPSATRAEILLALGRAQAHAQGVEHARVSFRVAADQARAVGRADLLAQAALGFAHRPNASGLGDGEAIALLDESLVASERLDPAVATRMRSRVAAELRYAEPARARAMSDSALGAARALHEPAVLAQTLDDCSFVRNSWTDPEGWVELNAELVRAARAAGDLELELLGQKGCVTGLLELGDLRAVDRELRALARTATSLGTPYARWLQAALLAMRSLFDGELASAERHISESAALGARTDSLDVALELQAQLAYLRLEQGRSGEIEEALRSQVRRFPEAPTWRAALARMHLATGRRADASHELAVLARADFRDVPRDRGWLPTLALASEVAAATGEERIAALLYELLSPHARLSVVAGSGLLYFGPVAHFLGLGAAAQSDWDTALSHFEQACAIEERIGARVWKANTELAWARALLARDAAGDRKRATQLARRAEAAAGAHGWPALAAHAAALATPHGRRSTHPPRSRPRVRRRVTRAE
jgi:DNA-binding winged helix-turn-helix (wHTH) protein